MAKVIRVLDPTRELCHYMPEREVIEPETSELSDAVRLFIADLMTNGITEEQGPILVRLNSGLEVQSSYTIPPIEG